MAGIRLIAQIRTKEGKAQEFIKAWGPHLKEVNEEPGCLQYEMFQSAVDPDQLVLLEHWESEDAFKAHWEVERNQPNGPGVPSVNDLVAPPRYGPGGPEIYPQAHHYLDGTTWKPLEE